MKLRNTFHAFFMASALLLGLVSNKQIMARGKTDAANGKSNIIHAVTANDYTPLNFIDPKTGEAVGWEYDAVNEIAKRLGMEVQWSVVSWDAMIQAIREEQYDVGMDGISITEERKTQVDFSVPYMDSAQYILVRATEERFRDAKGLADNPKLLIGAQPGNTNFYTAVYDILDGNEENPRLKLFDGMGLIVQALINGDIDATLMDIASSRGYIGASGESLKVLNEKVGEDQFGFIFPKGSELRAKFDEVIPVLKEEGFFDRLSTKWFYEYGQE